MFNYKKVDITPSATDFSRTEFQKAMADLKAAERNFENADAEYFETANAELSAAKEKLNAFFKWNGKVVV